MARIKMRINYDSDSVCENCGRSYKNTKEMYDMMFCGNKYTICFECVDELFQKTLSATCKYNGKVKSKEDLARIERSKQVS